MVPITDGQVPNTFGFLTERQIDQYIRFAVDIKYKI